MILFQVLLSSLCGFFNSFLQSILISLDLSFLIFVFSWSILSEIFVDYVWIHLAPGALLFDIGWSFRFIF